ncbi:hypothetical protein PMAYCL1PPCAC_09082, partial [Pristionchus mayeri]
RKEREIVNKAYAQSQIDSDLLYVSLDDMSNCATKLPNLKNCRSKSIPDTALVRADLSAALFGKTSANSNYTADLFLDVGNVYGSGANATINFLLESLMRMKELPPHLFIQVDGSRTNKNKVFFAFISHLVEKGIFSKVNIN